MVITTISLDQATHARVRHLAIDQRINFRDLVRQALADYVARHTEKR